MTRYGQAAVEAVKLIDVGTIVDPHNAWTQATISIFGISLRKGNSPWRQLTRNSCRFAGKGGGMFGVRWIFMDSGRTNPRI